MFQNVWSVEHSLTTTIVVLCELSTQFNTQVEKKPTKGIFDGHDIQPACQR